MAAATAMAAWVDFHGREMADVGRRARKSEARGGYIRKAGTMCAHFGRRKTGKPHDRSDCRDRGLSA
jgi:hypothetical protein